MEEKNLKIEYGEDAFDIDLASAIEKGDVSLGVAGHIEADGGFTIYEVAVLSRQPDHQVTLQARSKDHIQTDHDHSPHRCSECGRKRSGWALCQEGDSLVCHECLSDPKREV